ncbi:MAG TPA: hypothetical protein VL947_11970 [Cytophagales bacterium]|nr:hypothetical protein [Cytophagales bacterium]
MALCTCVRQAQSSRLEKLFFTSPTAVRIAHCNPEVLKGTIQKREAKVLTLDTAVRHECLYAYDTQEPS